jgi:hypothetical protein
MIIQIAARVNDDLKSTCFVINYETKIPLGNNNIKLYSLEF